jgi:hypothetical protein
MQVLPGLRDQPVSSGAERVVISESSSAAKEVTQVDRKSFAWRACPKQSRKHCLRSRGSHPLFRQSPGEFSSLPEGSLADAGSLRARAPSSELDHSGFQRLART